MFAANLAVGQPLYAKVDGVVSPLGKVIAAHETREGASRQDR
jgi:hypothetical protein